MTVKNLSETSFNELLDCFLQAFKNYYVNMPVDRAYYKERWKASKLNYRFSYGMFHEERLVGFILHSVDERNGTLTAYNAGTGVIPEYRGNRIVSSIYNYAFKELKQQGIKKSILEVITENEAAIRSYKSVGFKISRKLCCFKGNIQLKNSEAFKLNKLELKQINWNVLPHQSLYSWDYQKASVLEGNYSFYYVLNKNKPESYLIINHASTHIAQLNTLEPDSIGWNRLFSAIKSISSTITIHNVDESLTELIEHLEKVGLKNQINQYEMELELHSR